MGLLYLMGESVFNPRTLFANGEQGLWLDPSQMSTLYQDSNGVTPCTAAGDPIGLILDQSRGGLSQIGADLVTNGTFAADTDWTKGANWTIGSGVATKTGGAANNLTQTIGSTAAAWYRISLDVTRTAGTLTVSLGTSGTTYAITAAGSYTAFFLAGSGTQTLTLAGDSSFEGTVDNVVVRNVPGNHAYQTTSASRPTLARIPSSGRRNLLNYSEQFDVTTGGWNPSQASVSANATAAPDGTSTADKLNANTNNSFHGLDSNFAVAVVSGSTYTLSVYAKSSEYNFLRLGLASALFGNVSCYFDLANGTVGTRNGGVSAAIANAGSGWYRCSFTVTATSSGNANQSWIYVSQSDNQSGYVGSATSGIFIWGAQLETGSTATNYQKVVATTDVTESGVGDLWHLVFDGSDDSLTTNSIDMTGTAQMTTVIGIRSLANTGQIVLESSANYNSNVGTCILGRDAPGLFTSGLNGNGVAINYATVSATASRTDVLSQLLDNSSTTNAGENSLRLNAVDQSLTYVQASPNSNNGNFGNYQLFIGRRNQATLPFNGHIYQLIIRGRTTPTGKLLEAERFVARRTGVTGI